MLSDTSVIIKDFLEPKDFNHLVGLLDGEFPWYLGTKVTEYIESPFVEYSSKKEQKQLCHVFINHLQKSIFLDEMMPLIKKLGAKTIYRIKANLTLNLGSQQIGGWHYDNDQIDDMKTAILYLNTNNGFTLLEDGTKIHSEANKLLIIDSNILHTSVSQSDTEERFVININYK